MELPVSAFAYWSISCVPINTDTVFPIPWPTLLRLAAALPGSRRRNFLQEARSCAARLRPPLQVTGEPFVPRTGPCVVTVNHYARPGFHAWWLTLAVSAVVPVPIHWVVTAAWTYPGGLRRRLLTPLSRRLFRRMAAVYGFTCMPPMPPDPAEVAARAAAVRRVLAFARQAPNPVIGLAPEGRDAPGGVLQMPPPGAGRFLLSLAGLGLAVVPVGLFERDGLVVHFGPAYQLSVPAGLSPEERDRCASRQVMARIAALLPAELRGDPGETPIFPDPFIPVEQP